MTLCLMCGEFFVQTRNSKGSFCSQKCWREYEKLSPQKLRKKEASI
jgi:hypothetical protein